MVVKGKRDGDFGAFADAAGYADLTVMGDDNTLSDG